MVRHRQKAVLRASKDTFSPYREMQGTVRAIHLCQYKFVETIVSTKERYKNHSTGTRATSGEVPPPFLLLVDHTGLLSLNKLNQQIAPYIPQAVEAGY